MVYCENAFHCQRFFPSEFANEAERCQAVEPMKTVSAIKSKIHQMIAAEKIPYTIVCSNCFSGFHLPTLAQTGASGPPQRKSHYLRGWKSKREEDIGTYTIRVVDDPRTLNKALYIRPPGNICSFNDLVSLWEKKIGKTLKRIYLPEEQLLKNIKETSPPINVYLAVYHSIFVKGDPTNFEIEPSFGVEAAQLYPDPKIDQTLMDDSN
uniref:NmrA-like domain-containing protein n=1 Tax=Quercus lobata TaxID=97700 RepID=A0A7N2MYR8_QUELO